MKAITDPYRAIKTMVNLVFYMNVIGMVLYLAGVISSLTGFMIATLVFLGIQVGMNKLETYMNNRFGKGK